jgi:hypothetical protein
MMFDWAVSHGLIAKGPCWGDEFPVVGDGIKQAYRFHYQREHGDRVFTVETARVVLNATDIAVSNAGLNKNNSTGYRGVSERSDGRFEAYIVRKCSGVKNKIHLGEFDNPDEAGAAYRAAAEANGIGVEKRMQIGSRLFCAVSHLAANTGAYCKDMASLWHEDLKLGQNYLDRTRTISGEYWQAVLWPETVERIEEYLRFRPAPDRTHREYTSEWEHLVFLSSTGQPINWDSEKTDANGNYLHTNRKDIMRAAMRKLLINLGLKVKGVNFGAWRHTFETAASAALGLTRDELERHDAVLRLGARKLPNARNGYVKLPVDRLKPITDVVRAALWPDRVQEEGSLGR